MCEEFLRRELVITEAMAGYNGLRDSIKNGELFSEVIPEVMSEKVPEQLISSLKQKEY